MGVAAWSMKQLPFASARLGCWRTINPGYAGETHAFSSLSLCFFVTSRDPFRAADACFCLNCRWLQAYGSRMILCRRIIFDKLEMRNSWSCVLIIRRSCCLAAHQILLPSWQLITTPEGPRCLLTVLLHQPRAISNPPRAAVGSSQQELLLGGGLL